MSGAGANKGVVLVVEDDLDFGEFLVATLDDDGYQTELVMDGDAVVERAMALKPQGITLDLLLPGRTGIAIYRTLRANQETRDIPIVIITGVGTEGKRLAVERFFKNRSVPPPERVLRKPVEPEALLAAAATAFGPGPSAEESSEH